jgi:hypothetical protein
MAAIECKVAMCISRLVEFELLLELKFEQKKGTSLHIACCKDVSSLARLSVSLHRAVEVCRTSGNPLLLIVFQKTLVGIPFTLSQMISKFTTLSRPLEHLGTLVLSPLVQ